ncbi:GNAT family N-acetyltransferase [Salinibacterium sp. ZJ450]|uniref:GNAT family N-acetyltransferase n=1 Tax=Salinibacterium sp. ZJ450 TaxID=2708338 RepID=UPI00141E31AB|nr:GNAT family protein [Salinibacterium sp. ZJ450]
MIPYEFSAPLEADRVSLRMLTDQDVDVVHSYQSREDVCRYMLYEPRDHATVVAKVAEWSQHSRLEQDSDYLQLAVERRSDRRVLGDLYFTIKSVANQSAEIGWSLHPDHQGQGYASEAASAMLDVAFRVMRLHRVVAELDPRNDPSVALCRRLGMREEARFVEDLRFKGEWADTGVYAILAREFLAR